MSFRQGLAYVLRRGWLWPWIFWLRPLDVVRDTSVEKREWPELACAAFGGAIWGAVGGYVLWLWTGDIHGIWVLAVVFAVAGAIAVVAAVVATVTVTVTVGVAGAGANANANVNAGAVAVAGVVAGWVYFLIGIGILLGLSLPFSILSGIIIIIALATTLLTSWTVSSEIRTSVDVPDWAIASFIILWLFGLPLCAFALYPQAPVMQAPLWGIALFLTLGIGALSGFISQLSQRSAAENRNLRPTTTRQTNWLTFLWTLFPILALGAWWPDPETPNLNTKLDVLALFLALGAPLLSGLPLYPLTALIALWQCRYRRVRSHTPKSFRLMAPFRWQTFAYPLPGLWTYLIRLAQHHGCITAFKAIQELQFWSLQMRAGRRAALALAEGGTALTFCGEVAIRTNGATLVPLSLAGAAAQSVVVLRPKQEKEDEQPLQLYAGIFPPKAFRFPGIPAPPDPSWVKALNDKRERPLAERIIYALQQLDVCQLPPAHTTDFRKLLQGLQRYAEATDLRTALAEPLPVRGPDKMTEQTLWMAGGWDILTRFDDLMGYLTSYRDLTTANAKQALLNRQSKELRSLEWQDLPEYWALIANELVEHWVELLQQEAKQAREWLRLEIAPNKQTLSVGRQSLLLDIHNPTGVLARELCIHMEDSEELYWNIRETQCALLEGGQHTQLQVELETNHPGHYRISGQLEAKDLDDTPFRQPFAFSIDVAQTGRIYQKPGFQPYVAGEGLGDDRTFVGRADLRHDLYSLWRQPGGKPAVALVGQRRIGKTSLLNKIERDGLAALDLLPVLIDVQGCTSEYDFLNTAARKMAKTIGVTQPDLNRDEPYVDLKDFLLSLIPQLNKHRFLLMLDEADLIPALRLGDLLPGFLRSLMQGSEYPTLLLFCGTHALARMGRDYASILFNTAHFYTVSYLSERESGELLEKPARNILEFDPAVLQQAYRLTRGQPQLLQSLGMVLISQFNAVVFNGQSRSNYVDLNDLEQAASTVVKQNNTAFSQHWEHTDAATHRVLSVLAWATDETNRRQRHIDSIEAMMRETRLTLPRETTFKILERLLEEEFLIGDGPTYRFAVPLYRRWIAWRWPPTKVKEEVMNTADLAAKYSG